MILKINSLGLLLIFLILFSCSNENDASIINLDDEVGIIDETEEVVLSDRIIFVSSLATGTEEGLTWENAFTELQKAIDFSLKGDEIWVAEGTYIPPTETDRSISFIMKDGVKMYGGFSGVETQIDQRNWVINKTILSGEIGDQNSTSDNCFNVIKNTSNYLTLSSVLDGFIITKGNAGDPEPHERGGGVFNKKSSPTIRNCKFIDNEAQYGAGIYNLGGSSPYIDNCEFIDNNATKGGGGVYNFLNAFPTIINCVISGNKARDLYGGGMYNFHASPLIINTCISGNYANLGGAIYNTNDSSPIIINTTITGNYAYNVGGAIYNVTSLPQILNSIIWNNLDSSAIDNINYRSIYNDQRSETTYSYSLVEFLFPQGDGNLDGTINSNAPNFVVSIDPTNSPSINGDFNLISGSVTIDKGNNQLNNTLIDLSGNERIKNNTIDLGAYEF